MGRRSGTETIAALMLAFSRERTWCQADLARAVGVTVQSLRTRLDDLVAAGVPLERTEDHPHVYWSVPSGWLPGLVTFDADQGQALLRILIRHGPSPERDQLLEHVVRALPRGTLQDAAIAQRVAVVPTSAGSEPYLHLVEDAIAQKRVLRMNYYTSSRGCLEWREASPVRLFVGPPARFLGVCHRRNGLRWFRVDNVAAGKLVTGAEYRSVAASEVDKIASESVAGFHGAEAPIECRFLVRNPDARWVHRNLPCEADVQSHPDGIAVSLRTCGLVPLARFIVGLGSAVEVDTKALADLVEHLASGALKALKRPAKTSVVTRKRDIA